MVLLQGIEKDTGAVVLADEASHDVEDCLEDVGKALGVDDPMTGSGSCARVGDNRPSGPELEVAVREAHAELRRFERWRAEQSSKG